MKLIITNESRILQRLTEDLHQTYLIEILNADADLDDEAWNKAMLDPKYSRWFSTSYVARCLNKPTIDIRRAFNVRESVGLMDSIRDLTEFSGRRLKLKVSSRFRAIHFI